MRRVFTKGTTFEDPHFLKISPKISISEEDFNDNENNWQGDAANCEIWITKLNIDYRTINYSKGGVEGIKNLRGFGWIGLSLREICI